MSADRVLVDPDPTRDLGLRLIRAAQRLDDLLPELRELRREVGWSPAPDRLLKVGEIARGVGNDLTWLADEVVRVDNGPAMTVPDGDLRTARLDAQAARSCPDQPPAARNPIGEFVGGAIDSLEQTADTFNGLTVEAVIDPGQWADNWNQVGQGMIDAVTNPGDLYDAVVDPDTFRENPSRWFGQLAPDALAAMAGAGAATRAGRTVSLPDLPGTPTVPSPEGLAQLPTRRLTAALFNRGPDALPFWPDFTDPTIPPATPFQWRGRGPTGGEHGAWHIESPKVSLHPDLDHPAPIGPHWDLITPDGSRYRLFEDGSWERRSRN